MQTFTTGKHKRTILIEHKTSLDDMEVAALLFRVFQTNKATWGFELPKTVYYSTYKVEITEATPVLKVNITNHKQ